PQSRASPLWLPLSPALSTGYVPVPDACAVMENHRARTRYGVPPVHLMAITSPRWGEVRAGKNRAGTSGEPFLEITLAEMRNDLFGKELELPLRLIPRHKPLVKEPAKPLQFTRTPVERLQRGDVGADLFRRARHGVLDAA